MMISENDIAIEYIGEMSESEIMGIYQRMQERFVKKNSLEIGDAVEVISPTNGLKTSLKRDDRYKRFGWDNGWINGMNDTVEELLLVEDIHFSGIKCNNGFWYPYFLLVKNFKETEKFKTSFELFGFNITPKYSFCHSSRTSEFLGFDVNKCKYFTKEQLVQLYKKMFAGIYLEHDLVASDGTVYTLYTDSDRFTVKISNMNIKNGPEADWEQVFDILEDYLIEYN